jgi:hypothetical protein
VWQGGFYHRNAVFSRYIDMPLDRLLREGARQPQALRMVVSDDVIAGIAASADVSRAAGASDRRSNAAASLASQNGSNGSACTRQNSRAASRGTLPVADITGLPDAASESRVHADGCNGRGEAGALDTAGICLRASLAAAFRYALDVRYMIISL